MLNGHPAEARVATSDPVGHLPVNRHRLGHRFEGPVEELVLCFGQPVLEDFAPFSDNVGEPGCPQFDRRPPGLLAAAERRQEPRWRVDLRRKPPGSRFDPLQRIRWTRRVVGS